MGEGTIRANGMTLAGLCKGILKKNKDLLTQCTPISDEQGKVHSVRLVVKGEEGMKPLDIRVHSGVDDVRTDVVYIEYINFEIQKVCQTEREKRSKS